MRIALALILLLLLNGCVIKKTQPMNEDQSFSNQTSITETSTAPPQSSEICDAATIHDISDILNYIEPPLEYIGIYDTDELGKEFITRYGFYPSQILLFENNTLSINMQFHGGTDLSFSDEDFNLGESPSGGKYFYKGVLTKLNNNVYSSKGEFISPIQEKAEFVSNEIDFFLIFKEDRLFFVFEDMNMNDLLSYESSSFAKLWIEP